MEIFQFCRALLKIRSLQYQVKLNLREAYPRRGRQNSMRYLREGVSRPQSQGQIAHLVI
jgi:hypothetical protein